MTDLTAIVVALIAGTPAVLTLLSQRSAAKKAEQVAEEQRAMLAKVATEEKLAEVAEQSDGRLTALADKLAAVEGELRRLKADPTATTPEAGGPVNLAPQTGAVTVPKADRRRHDDPQGIDIRGGERNAPPKPEIDR